MKARTWKKKICEAMQTAGTYNPAFTLVIDSMAQTLELRDEAMKQFAEEGGRVSLKRKNRAKQPNKYKNPLIGVIKDLNGTALQYARELGITARSLKSMNKDAMRKKGSFFSDLLNDITDDQAADMDQPQFRS